MLEDKVIIVTGAGSGIGRAAAVIMARAGARMVVSDLDRKSAEATAELIQGAGGLARPLKVDVAEEDQIIELIELSLQAFGRLDGAFNNAGIRMKDKIASTLAVEEWDNAMVINARSVFLCMKYQIPAMSKTGGGAIVNTSSGNGVVGNASAIEYVASKHAVIGATRGAAAEAATTKVRVNEVPPGLIVSAMTSERLNDPHLKKHFDTALARHTVGRFGTPEDVGYAVKWLLSDEAAFVNGAAIAVDGGYTAR
jgi:NAD(P)-dependent dehydrogenase (short-subunit alcohol dehydrogenase family)